MSSPAPHLILPESPVSVAGVTQYIQDLLEQDDQLRQLWVMGEVSSANQYRSGLFFTLQDPDASAAIDCVVWRNRLSSLTTMPTVGEQVMALGQVRLHRQRGHYQLNVWQLLPGGQGLRALRQQQLRQRLAAEGLFDPERKRSLPPHPHTIAVVTSPQAAAWGDIKRTLKQRYPGLQVLFSPALVQGGQAPDSIVQAIQRVEMDGRAEVLILARGGGATEDLECFNDERVVRAIAHCTIPVISGIGHHRDESLADLVADVHVHTPTAAAEEVIPLFTDVIQGHQERRVALASALQQHIHLREKHLKALRERLRRLQLDRWVSQEQQRLQWHKQTLQHLVVQTLQQADAHCQLLRQTLESLDPAAALQRGYALVQQQDGSIVRSSEQVQPQQYLWVQLAQGRIEVKVEATEHALSSEQPDP